MKKTARFITASLMAAVLAWPTISCAQGVVLPSPCATILCLGLYDETGGAGGAGCYAATAAFFSIPALTPAVALARTAYLMDPIDGVPTMCPGDAIFITPVIAEFGFMPVPPIFY